MFTSLPADPAEFGRWTWPDFRPLFAQLEALDLSANGVDAFLDEWTALADRIDETQQRLRAAARCHPADTAATVRHNEFVQQVVIPARAVYQRLEAKLLDSGVELPDFAVPLRAMRARAETRCPTNGPLQEREEKTHREYSSLIAAQTIPWKGQDTPLPQLAAVYDQKDRKLRERAWRLEAARRLVDRSRVDELWRQLVRLRREMASNAGFRDYREYRWRQLGRLDYTPQDCLRFHAAIEEFVQPVITRLYERRRRRLGARTVRPWDISVDPLGRPPLPPVPDGSDLVECAAGVFQRVDRHLGNYFEMMRAEGLLCVEYQPREESGGYCARYPVSRRPFVLMNASGSQRDVWNLFHQAGHAFQVFETGSLPYRQQRDPGAEFTGVAAITMEFLGAQFLPAEQGSFYPWADAARTRIQHLEHCLLRWSVVAITDAFDHWVYGNADAALDPAECAAQWRSLWLRYLPAIDWSGLEDELQAEWQRHSHLFLHPFSSIEDGVSQLGAVQIWANAAHDPAQAVSRYHQALSLGGTRTLSELFAAAGAELSFDDHTLREAANRMEDTIDDLERG